MIDADHGENYRDVSQDFELLLRCVILDFSAVTFVDPSAVDVLRQLQSDLAKLDVVVYFAACSGEFGPVRPPYLTLLPGPVFEKFLVCDRYQKKESQFNIFPTIHDAVLFAQSHVLRTKLV